MVLPTGRSSTFPSPTAITMSLIITAPITRRSTVLAARVGTVGCGVLVLRSGRRVVLVAGSAWGGKEEGVEWIRAGDSLGGRPSLGGLGEALGVELTQDLLGADAATLARRG